MPKKKHGHDQIRRLIAGCEQLFETGHAQIEGLNFDLRHPAIPPDCWYAPNIGLLVLFDQPMQEPYIYFPWQKRRSLEDRIAADREEYMRSILTICDNPAAESASMISVHIMREWAARTKRDFDREQVMETGDTVRIDSITTVSVGGPLDPEPDREIKLAYLEISRASGAVMPVSGPLKFFRHGSLLAGPAFRTLTLPTIATRICAANGISNVFDLCLCAEHLVMSIHGEDAGDNVDLTLPEEMLTLVQNLALQRASIAAWADGAAPNFSDMAQTTKGSMLDLCNGKPSADGVEQMVNKAVMLGYLWRQYEDQRFMRPHAELSLKVGEAQRAAGKRRGLHKAAEAATTRQIVEVAAVRLREAKPHLSQDDLAEAIIRGTKTRLGTHRTVVAHISALEKEGRLKRREVSA